MDALLEHVALCAECRHRLQLLESHVSPLTGLADPHATDHPYETEQAFRAVLPRLREPQALLALQTELQVGSLLGNYRLIERIGAGGMGVVYRAVHEKLARQVAVKVLNERLEGNLGARARFSEEMRLGAVFDHPRLVRVTDAGHDAGRDYLVMELLDGVDLSRLVRRIGPLSTPDACELVRQAAEGLVAAHRGGIIHRDVKPSNLMLTSTGVKILDLGASRDDHPTAAAGLTATGQVLGTWDYMAPEQRQGACLADARSDLYSLGATLCFLKTGGPPAPCLVENLEAGLQSLLVRLLAPDPADRFASAAEVLAAIAPLAQGHRVERLLDQYRGQTPLAEEAPKSVKGTADRRTRSGQWWFAGSLSGLAACGGLAWIILNLNLPDAQQDTEPVSATTAMNTPPQGTSAVEPTERDVAEWLIARGGAVAAYHGNGPDGWIRSASALPSTPFLIQKIELPPFGPTLSDGEVARLRQLRALEGLACQGTAISSSALQQLAQNRKLKWLYLSRSGLTDRELVAIGQLPKLENLDLSHAAITDAGLRSLADLERLAEIRLSHTLVGDEAVTALHELPNLASLDLTATRITDTGLAGLSVLPRLKLLQLDETGVTDAGLEHLAAITTLRKVSLFGARTTPEGRTRLRSRLSNAVVEPRP
uniref:Protein kinase domain-containing protein n=1 Tax=Schlesneria paludicola TaxID=360056 RepID=A0A7C2JYL9_9PLAN